ncbi:NAD(P)-binding protein [Leucogyrophana mollusca]|uniref:NAD(P)-binding protein n=1 Tax=Leucogyrophana mollusca TaxID=85980 RepID=A0ACB8BFY3_9AGAM|nr:NAD(P)-binding protein [Leucogyrophana mollusca]
MSSPKVWLITGASTGFGRSVTEFALQQGDIAVATLRKPDVLSDLVDRYPRDRLLVVKLDVTKQADIDAAFAQAKSVFGRVDFVLNNAGFGIVAEIEGTRDKTARDVFEVNFWGAANVSREAVRFFREENSPAGGRLLQMSSLSGIESTPGVGYYCASKFALEGLSEGLSRELDPSWNIKIIILEPGPFRTNAPVENAVIEPLHPAYRNPSLPTAAWRNVFPNVKPYFNGDPDKFAAAVYRVAYLEDPPLRLPIHEASLASLRKKGRELLAAADKYESWSEGVIFQDIE